MRPIFAILPFLMTPASELAAGGGGGAPIGTEKVEKVDPAEALKQLEDKTLPMSQRLTVAMNALRGIDPTNQLADVQRTLAEAQASLATRDQELAAAKADLASRDARITALETDVRNLETRNAQLEQAEQDLEKCAEAKSKEKVAALGFPASQLPAATAAPSGSTNDEKIAELHKQIAATSDPLEKGKLSQQVWDLMLPAQGKN
jgi:chromosome segregation ATPase